MTRRSDIAFDDVAPLNTAAETVTVYITRDELVRHLGAPPGPETTLEVLEPHAGSVPVVRLVVTLSRAQLRRIADAPAGASVDIRPVSGGQSIAVQWSRWRDER